MMPKTNKSSNVSILGNAIKYINLYGANNKNEQ